MAILEAYYITDSNKNKITPNVIIDKEDYARKFKSHLFCCEENCNAELDYVEISGKYVKKYFRTHPRSKHSEDCPYKFDTIANASSKYGINLYAILDNKSKREILNGTYKKAKKTISRNYNIELKKTNKNKSSIVNKELTKKDSINYISTVDPNAEVLPEGRRRSKVLRKHCDSISSKDFDKTTAVFGDVKHIDIGDNYINIYFNTSMNNKVYIQIYTPFANNSKFEYELLKKLDVKNNILLNNLIAAIGIVEHKNDEVFVPVMDAESIRIDNKSISNFFMEKIVGF